jgi:hypothetical protein
MCKRKKSQKGAIMNQFVREKPDNREGDKK